MPTIIRLLDCAGAKLKKIILGDIPQILLKVHFGVPIFSSVEPKFSA